MEQISITKFPLVAKSGEKAPKSVEKLVSLQLDLRKRIITNQLINYCDQISTLSFDDYSEESLIVHINSMETCKETCSVLNSILTRFSAGIDKLLILSQTSLEHSNPANKGSIEDLFTPTIIDAVSSTCAYSARRAIEYTVTSSAQGLNDVTDAFIKDGRSTWLGGGVCKMYIDRLSKYLTFLVARIPKKHREILVTEVALCDSTSIHVFCFTHFIVYSDNKLPFYCQNSQVVRMSLVRYLLVMFSRYKEDKKLKLSRKGVEQIVDDLDKIHAWIAGVAKDESDPLNFYDECIVISHVQAFVKSDEKDLLNAFATAVSSCGAPYGFHLYDLIRVTLKFRVNVAANDRRRTLGLCAKFLLDLDRVLIDESSFVVIPKGKFMSCFVLDELFPEIGTR